MAFSIFEPDWNEDEVVHALTKRWRPVSIVLASGGNQGTLHYVTASGRRKAPDLVVYCDGRVVVIEAKACAASLFRGGAASDVSHLQSLLIDRARRERLLAKAAALLDSIGTSPHGLTLACGVLGGSAFSPAQAAAARGLVCIETLSADCVQAVARGSLLPDRCRAELD